METSLNQPHPEPAPACRERQLTLSLAAIVVAADICFWRENPRLSVGLFALIAAGIILANRPAFRWTRSTICIVALLVAAAVQSAVELCFSNVLVLIILLPALAGDTWYQSLRSVWSRWSEMLWNMAGTPARWTWLLSEIDSRRRKAGTNSPRAIARIARAFWIAVPGIFISLFFAIILGNGNAIFAAYTTGWAAAVSNWIVSLHIDFWHCFFWVFVAWSALPLLRPGMPPAKERFWTRDIPLLPELAAPGTARLQSAVTLGLLNVLFCCVNTIDAIYLWARRALPSGVNSSAFVHQGTGSLIVATLFSAILLAGLFQQARSVSGWTPLRLLGLLWVAQNLVLLAGVLLRVKLYVDAFDLTRLRVSLVLFLALVAAGFVLLAIHVWYRRTLGWLLQANMLATFFLFYTVQFLDTDRFIASSNVRLWQKSHGTRVLDLCYLKSLGPPAYDAIRAVADSTSNPADATSASDFLASEKSEARADLGSTSWASCQLRAMHFRQKLLSD